MAQVEEKQSILMKMDFSILGIHGMENGKNFLGEENILALWMKMVFQLKKQ